MSDVPYVADALLYRLREFVEKQIALKYQAMEGMYVAGERDGTELSLKLSEIVTLKQLMMNLEKEAKKQKLPQGVIDG